jgi:hypothetical protein
LTCAFAALPFCVLMMAPSDCDTIIVGIATPAPVPPGATGSPAWLLTMTAAIAPAFWAFTTWIVYEHVPVFPVPRSMTAILPATSFVIGPQPWPGLAPPPFTVCSGAVMPPAGVFGLQVADCPAYRTPRTFRTAFMRSVRTRQPKRRPGSYPASAKAGAAWLIWRSGRQIPTIEAGPVGLLDASTGVRSIS